MPRKPMTKEAKIRRALEAGVPVPAIAQRYNTSYQYVNLIRRKMRKAVEVVDTAHVQEHSVGPLPDAPRAGLVSLQAEIPQPTAGITSIPLGVGEVREVVVEPKPTLWQRFKLWMWGRT
jgi:hypothetical protein